MGAIERVARPGEWRTNVDLGARRRPLEPSAGACELAIRAADAVKGDLVGVDLMPLPGGSYVVLEVNGAVDFTDEYSREGCDVFGDAVKRLACSGHELLAAAL